MSESCETIAVNVDGQKVIINKSDMTTGAKLWVEPKPKPTPKAKAK